MQDDDVFPCVLDRASPGDIRIMPFPHLVIEGALPASLCTRLLETRPPFPGDPSARPNLRLPIPGAMLRSLPFYDPIWARFAARHLKPDISRRVAALFQDHWPTALPDLRDTALRFGVQGEDEFDAADILVDARLEIVSPSPDAPGAHRRGHVDTPNRLFSALYYLRDPADQTAGGGLELFRFVGKPDCRLDVFELPASSIEPVATIPYRANTLVLFPNRPEAVHGAEVRAATTCERAYVFLTAEVAQDLF